MGHACKPYCGKVRHIRACTTPAATPLEGEAQIVRVDCAFSDWRVIPVPPGSLATDCEHEHADLAKPMST